MFWNPFSISVASGILVFSPSLLLFICSLVFFHLFISFLSFFSLVFCTFPLIFVHFPWFSSIVSKVLFTFSLVLIDFSLVLLLSCWKIRELIEKQKGNDKIWQENDRKITEKHDKKNRFFRRCSLMFSWFWCVMCHLDFHASLRMFPKYGDEIRFLKNGWWKSLWKWGATKLSHALGMPASWNSKIKN